MAELGFNAGDEVRFRLAQEEVDGIVLENPDSSVVLIKLKSGYNVGIPRDNILASRVLKKYERVVKEEKKSEVKRKKGLPVLGLVVTGGTIAAKLDAKRGGTSWLTDPGELMRFYPELFEMVDVKTIDVPFMTSSEAMTSEHWIKIAESVKKMVDDPEIKGVIVTHGTDFLHYTAAALSFFLQDLTKPVVLTYSQRSIDRASSDANLNLVCAARAALSDVAEVMLVGHANLNDEYCHAMRGSKVRKMHSSRRDAFQPINCEPIAKVWPDKIEFISEYRKSPGGKTVLDTSFTDKVALVKFYPGQDPSILDLYALKFKGVVIEVGGLGHLPPSEAKHNWVPALKKHIRQGLVICAAAQTIYGRLDPFVYSNGREIVDAGVIFLDDMLPETAMVKLGWVLGHFGWKGKVKEKMKENVSGELNERIAV
ncbi:MAG: Glu-tRNA(Gln) amidotransferase subunit GatD [Candidatus Liptonbacteria bacterium]|nr:Glu-tRNA(Gln) amidotransferase subunit GatD [Candidatus Pacearchaeota archaeon]MBM3257032.1 Glu-tRNA(Gln) amidotransferase subunit GatD [Candidatus Liptonbacteria bacterium]